MKDLVSVPASIRQRIEEAQNVPQNQLASAMAEAMRVLAQASPDLFSLLCASQLGHTQVVGYETETFTEEFNDPRHFLGIKTGENVRTKTTTRTRTKTHRFS